jgi:hypothetical protein
MYRGWSRSLGARVAARGRGSAAGEISETFAMRCVLMGISLHTPGFGKLQDVCRKHPVCALVRGITWLRLRALGSRTETGAAAARKLGRSWGERGEQSSPSSEHSTHPELPVGAVGALLDRVMQPSHMHSREGG